jgi:hypothetical protein
VRATAATLLLAAAFALAGADSSSAAYWRECGSQPDPGAGWYDVKADGIRCGKARRVARLYTAEIFAGYQDPSPDGFACRRNRVGYELAKVACRRVEDGRAQKVRFSYGA